MRWPRLTIGSWMGWTAVVALNVALVRAYVVHDMFYGGLLIFPALQVGLLRVFRARGRPRRFWVGFVVAGASAVLLLFSAEVFPRWASSRLLNRLLIRYLDVAVNLAFSHLPTRLADHLDEHQDQLLVALYFLPELAAALVGGAVVAGGAGLASVPEREEAEEERSGGRG